MTWCDHEILFTSIALHNIKFLWHLIVFKKFVKQWISLRYGMTSSHNVCVISPAATDWDREIICITISAICSFSYLNWVVNCSIHMWVYTHIHMHTHTHTHTHDMEWCTVINDLHIISNIRWLKQLLFKLHKPSSL